MTMSASDGKRIATYALGRTISGFILFAFHEVSESPASSHGDLDFKCVDHMYDAGHPGAPGLFRQVSARRIFIDKIDPMFLTRPHPRRVILQEAVFAVNRIRQILHTSYSVKGTTVSDFFLLPTLLQR